MAIFYLDYENGTDTTFTALTSCVMDNPSGSIVRITKAGHGLNNGEIVALTSFDTYWNRSFAVENVTATTFDLVDAVWRTTGDKNGTCTPTGGFNWANAWRTTTNSAISTRVFPGDELRFAKSPSPVSIGTATWTTAGDPDEVGGVSIKSSTNSSPISIETQTPHIYVTGDRVVIFQHNVNTYANSVWKITYVDATHFTLDDSVGNGTGANTGYVQICNARTLVLDTPQTLEIDNCDTTAWTKPAGSNLSISNITTTNQSEGYGCLGFYTGAMAVNNLQAYKTLSDTDYSAYDSISFTCRINSSSFAVGMWKLCLCSDTAGTTIVDTFDLPIVNGVRVQYNTIKKSGGGSLGSSIKSIALYSSGTAPTTSRYLYLDNIIACNYDGLSLNSLVSKSSADIFTLDESPWVPIGAIMRNNIVVFGERMYSGGRSAQITGFNSNTDAAVENVTTYCRRGIYTDIQVGYSGIIQRVAISGIDNNNRGEDTPTFPIKLYGGWNTSTNLRDGTTMYDGQCFTGKCFDFYNPAAFLDFGGFVAIRYYYGFYSTSNYGHSSNFGFTGSILCFMSGYFWPASGTTFDEMYNWDCTDSFTTCEDVRINKYNAYTISNFALGITSSDYFFMNDVLIYNRYNGLVSTQANLHIGTYAHYGWNSAVSPYPEIYSTGGNVICNKANNMIPANAYNRVVSGSSSTYGCYVKVTNINSTGYAYVLGSAGLAEQQAATAGGTGKEWKVRLNLDSYNAPFNFKIASILCNAGSLVTVGTYIKKNDIDLLDVWLECKDPVISGVTNAKSTYAPNDTSRNKVELTFTPTEAGVVDIYMAGSVLSVEPANNDKSNIASNPWFIIDDFEATQA